MKPPITAIPKPGGEVETPVESSASSLFKKAALLAHSEYMFNNNLDNSEAMKAIRALEKQAANNLKKEKEVGEILKDKNQNL